MDPKTRLRRLEEQYRLVLHSSDFVDDEIVEDVQPEMKGNISKIEREVDDLRLAHHGLLEDLEGKYMQACAGQLRTKSMWPKKGAGAVSQGA